MSEQWLDDIAAAPVALVPLIPGSAGRPALGVCTEDDMLTLSNVAADLLPGVMESLPSECRTCVAILSFSCSSGNPDDVSTCMMQCMIGTRCLALLLLTFKRVNHTGSTYVQLQQQRRQLD